MLDTLKEWFESLEQRERLMVIVCSVLVTLTLLYLLVVEPYIEHRQNLEQQVSEKQELIAWMQGAHAEIQALEDAGRQTTAGSGQSLFGVVDRTSKDAELDRAVRQITPDGDDAVRVRMEAARFDHTLQWLEELERNHGIEVSRVTFDQTDQSGRVNVSLSLERNGS
ncbi:general secretion pathway protein M [Natronospira proteinivora]|uniref:Type II secretion system protein M n=1 Tax=Natronospira proteinivora TaxID=1807133 RepID=A0ABT1GAC0_9GAMM|nr:type II secretion system protein M [Natronospira proteinivora]MCP1726877.1 general secretion pathway protein M [Natronospira proteinivora]